jgi:hypothetical protein
MSDFARSVCRLMSDLWDAAECEFWACPLSGDQPHHDGCLTGADS